MAFITVHKHFPPHLGLRIRDLTETRTRTVFFFFKVMKKKNFLDNFLWQPNNRKVSFERKRWLILAQLAENFLATQFSEVWKEAGFIDTASHSSESHANPNQYATLRLDLSVICERVPRRWHLTSLIAAVCGTCGSGKRLSREESLVQSHTTMRFPKCHGQFGWTLNAQREAVATRRGAARQQEAHKLHPALSSNSKCHSQMGFVRYVNYN